MKQAITSNKDINSYGIFIDLQVGQSINQAIQFKNEKAFDLFIKQMRKHKFKHEVGIKDTNGVIDFVTYDEFKKYFFN